MSEDMKLRIKVDKPRHKSKKRQQKECEILNLFKKVLTQVNGLVKVMLVGAQSGWVRARIE